MLLRKDALMKVDKDGKNMSFTPLAYTLSVSFSLSATSFSYTIDEGGGGEGMLDWIRGMHGRARARTCPSIVASSSLFLWWPRRGDGRSEGDKLGRNSADAICINEAAPTMLRCEHAR